jgi:cell division protein FtsB
MEKKDIMSKSKKVLRHLLHVNKYLIVMVLGVLLVGFVPQNSWIAHMQNKSRISELKSEIALYQAQTKANLQQTRLLQSDPKALERVARERYMMKMDDEDIFVLSDDEPLNQNPIGNESVE